MKRATLFFSLSLALGAQDSVGGHRLQPGQSAAIGLESGGYPAQQGAPAERVEASRKFAGGGVDGDTQSREMVPLCSRPAGDEPRLVMCDGDIQKNQPNKGIRFRYRSVERAGRSASAIGQVGLPTINGSAGSTPARVLQFFTATHHEGGCQSDVVNGMGKAQKFGGVSSIAAAEHPGSVARVAWPIGRCTPTTRRFPVAVHGQPAMARLKEVDPGSQQAPALPGWWKRHLADSAAHATGTALDAASSWGQREANPILRSSDGRFGAQGMSIKLGIFAGMEFAKWKLARRYPHSKLVRAISLAPAAAFGGVAARNWSVR